MPKTIFQWYVTCNIKQELYCKLDLSPLCAVCSVSSVQCVQCIKCVQCVKSKMTWQRRKWAVDLCNYCRTNNCIPSHHSKDMTWEEEKESTTRAISNAQVISFNLNSMPCFSCHCCKNFLRNVFTGTLQITRLMFTYISALYPLMELQTAKTWEALRIGMDVQSCRRIGTCAILQKD